MNLINFRDPFDNVLANWINYDKFDNWYDNVGQVELGKTKYRWNEDDKTYTLESVMPGLTKKDVSVTFKADTLTIKCNKSVSEKDREFWCYHRQQYSAHWELAEFGGHDEMAVHGTQGGSV